MKRKTAYITPTICVTQVQMPLLRETSFLINDQNKTIDSGKIIEGNPDHIDAKGWKGLFEDDGFNTESNLWNN